MPQQPMYPGQANSPQTELAANIDDSQTTIPLLDASVLPEGPNLVVIGAGETAETVRYESINGNDLENCTRGFQGVAASWQSGQKVARNFTAYDYDALRENVEDHEQRITDTSDDLAAHKADESNPHGVTASQAGAINKNGDTGLKGSFNHEDNVFFPWVFKMGGSPGKALQFTDPNDESVKTINWSRRTGQNRAFQVFNASDAIDLFTVRDDGTLETNNNVIYHAGNSGPFYKGSGSPEGVVTANIGAIYQREDGGAGTTLYVKESGTGNTGWVAK